MTLKVPKSLPASFQRERLMFGWKHQGCRAVDPHSLQYTKHEVEAKHPQTGTFHPQPGKVVRVFVRIVEDWELEAKDVRPLKSDEALVIARFFNQEEEILRKSYGCPPSFTDWEETFKREHADTYQKFIDAREALNNALSRPKKPRKRKK